MAVFRAPKTRDYTVMSNHHLKNRTLSFEGKGAHVPHALVQLETEGYIVRRQGRDAHGRLSADERISLDYSFVLEK